MRIALIAHHVAPIAPPFVGGVESHTWYLARWLARRGHDVTLFALPGSDVPGVRHEPLAVDDGAGSEAARRDVSAMPAPFLAAHHAYLRLLVSLASRDAFDAIHINTLHYLPVAMADSLAVRPLLTLHCPPTPWLESALTVAANSGPLPLDVVAVSSALARGWSHVIPTPGVVPNGIDLEAWPEGPGGEECVWAGRIVPEKAPHLAIDAARAAGRRIRLAGPVIDADYHGREVEPRLGPDAVYVGHLEHDALSRLLGGAAVAIQSPVWEEPFGLSAAEAIASGTPIAAFARGGLTDVVTPEAGALAEPGSVASLAGAIERAGRLRRSAVRAEAERHLGVDAMGRLYEARYEELAERSGRELGARVEAPSRALPSLFGLQGGAGGVRGVGTGSVATTVVGHLSDR